MIRIGILCYDTQFDQIYNQIYKNDYIFTRISLIEKKSRIHKLFSFIKQIKNIDYLYYGYGAVNEHWKLLIANIFRKKIIMHWIGSDILALRNKVSTQNYLKKHVMVHFACSRFIVEELKEFGINAIELPIIPLNFNIEMMSPPKKHAALFYLPNEKEKFYGIKYLELLSKKFENINFYVVANTKYDFSYLGKNVINMGKLNKQEMDELYSKVSILVRIPEHDGLSLMLLEALLRGKQVIYKYNYPYTIKYNNDIELINEFSKIIKNKPEINNKGREYVLNNYKINDIRNKFYYYIFNKKEEKDED